MLNTCVLIGRLTADPEAKYLTSGVAVTNFRLAVDRSFKNRDGEKETDFFDVVCWRKLAEIVAQNIRKGRLVAVQGRLQQDRWQNKEGQNRSRVQVVADEVRFLDWPKDGQQQGRGKPSPSKSSSEDLLDEFLDDDDVPPF